MGTASDWTPLPAVGVPDRAISHVSIEMFTSSSESVIGTLFSFAHDIRNEMWLHHADVRRSHEGSSRSSVKTSSSNCRFVSSPSPLNVDILILSLERFFVYLKLKNFEWASTEPKASRYHDELLTSRGDIMSARVWREKIESKLDILERRVISDGRRNYYRVVLFFFAIDPSFCEVFVDDKNFLLNKFLSTVVSEIVFVINFSMIRSECALIRRQGPIFAAQASVNFDWRKIDSLALRWENQISSFDATRISETNVDCSHCVTGKSSIKSNLEVNSEKTKTTRQIFLRNMFYQLKHSWSVEMHNFQVSIT